MKIPVRLLWLSLASFALLGSAAANTIVYPVEGVDDLWKLNADDFRQKYGGINVTGLGVGDEGWYVRYRHENLTLFFGPLPTREEAQKKMWELESVRDAAIRNDPKLGSSQVDFVRFNFSGVYGVRGDTPFAVKRKSDDGKSGPDGDLDGDGIPNKDDPDMDGDGIPNEQDGDIDGDGIPNGQDKYPYGSAEAVGAGPGETNGSDKGGAAGKNGQLAGNDGNGNQAGNAGNQKDGNQKGGGRAGQSGAGQSGQSQGNSNNPVGAGENGMQQVASAQNGSTAGQQQGRQSGQRGNQTGQPAGQQGSQSGQAGQTAGQGSQSGQSGQAGQAGQAGQPGSPSVPGGQSGGSGSPLDLVALLFRKILGI